MSRDKKLKLVVVAVIAIGIASTATYLIATNEGESGPQIEPAEKIVPSNVSGWTSEGGESILAENTSAEMSKEWFEARGVTDEYTRYFSKGDQDMELMLMKLSSIQEAKDLFDWYEDVLKPSGENAPVVGDEAMRIHQHNDESTVFRKGKFIAKAEITAENTVPEGETVPYAQLIEGKL